MSRIVATIAQKKKIVITTIVVYDSFVLFCFRLFEGRLEDESSQIADAVAWISQILGRSPRFVRHRSSLLASNHLVSNVCFCSFVCRQCEKKNATLQSLRAKN